jgi:CheY-like chemotaxis protein
LRNYISQIDKAGEQAETLIRQLLAFSRRQILQPKILNLNYQLRDMENMMRRLLGEDLELIMQLAPDLGNIQADPGQIQQLIMNLLVNSRDAIAGNGRIIIETQNIQLNGEYLKKHQIVKAGHYVMLAVSDNGQGIKKEHQDYIFEPFFTTKEEGKGTGLGLATVYGIVKQNDGYIWVYSEYGIGTTFKIYLPRMEGEVKAVTEVSKVEPVFEGHETILVVEDEEDVRQLICETLEKYHFEVLQAPHGEMGLKLCRQNSNPIDLVITDVVMPHMSGKEFIERLIEIHPEIRVLYISGYTNEAIVHEGILEANTHFLQKPFTPSELIKTIRRLIDQQPLVKN